MTGIQSPENPEFSAQDLERLYRLKRELQTGRRSDMLPPEEPHSLQEQRQFYQLRKSLQGAELRESTLPRGKFATLAQKVLAVGDEIIERYGWSRHTGVSSYTLADKLCGDNRYAKALQTTARTGRTFDEIVGDKRRSNPEVLRLLFYALSDIKEKGHVLPGSSYSEKAHSLSIEFAQKLGFLLPDEKISSDNQRMKVPTEYTSTSMTTVDIPHPADQTLSMHLVVEHPSLGGHPNRLLTKGFQIHYHPPSARPPR